MIRINPFNRLLASFKQTSSNSHISNEVIIPPIFKTYYPSTQSMSDEQLNFYKIFVERFQDGQPISVQGNISYVFCLTYDILNNESISDAASILDKIKLAYKNEDKIESYLSEWQSDCYSLLGDYEKALSIFPPPQLNSRSSKQTNALLNLKVAAKAPVEGHDLITLFGAKITKYAKSHLPALKVYLDQIIETKQQSEGDILSEWIEKYDVPKHSYSYFSGVPINRSEIKPFDAYSFDLVPEIEEFCSSLTRQAENALREDSGLPKVGEGWLSETQLYYELVEAFPNLEIVQHASPDWLGKQHLDVYFPKLKLGIEYQGSQHDEPVAFFGGEEAFQKTQERDKRKKRLCLKNSTQLIEVRPGYNLQGLIENIERFVL